MKQIDTTAEDWQRVCLELAKTQETFEVRNVSVKNLVFLNEFCAAYKYNYQAHGVSGLNLIPENQNISQQPGPF